MSFRMCTILAVAGLAAPCALAQSAAITPDETRALVAELIADADARSSLLQSGGAGHDGHFFLSSPDNSFRLNISGQTQFRYIANFRDDDDGATDDFEGGFFNPRTALRFDGHIFDPALTYAVQGNFDSDGGDFFLEDAYVGYTFEDHAVTLLAGQFRMPVLWEDVLFETKSLAVTESVVNAVFSSGRSQGVAGHHAAEDWRIWLGVSDGIRTANTPLGTEASDVGFTCRAEWKIDGEWAQFNEFTSAPGSEFFAKLGGGVHYDLGAHRPGFDETDLLAYTADFMTGGDGWNAFIAGVGLYTDNDSAGSFSDFGFIIQGGVFVAEATEIFARWDTVLPDSDRDGDEDFNTITVGANHYLHGQAAKFTLDVAWFLDDPSGNDLVAGLTAGPNASRGSALGLLPSDEDNQFAIRAQFQLLF